MWGGRGGLRRATRRTLKNAKTFFPVCVCVCVCQQFSAADTQVCCSANPVKSFSEVHSVSVIFFFKEMCQKLSKRKGGSALWEVGLLLSLKSLAPVSQAFMKCDCRHLERPEGGWGARGGFIRLLSCLGWKCIAPPNSTCPPLPTVKKKVAAVS